MIGLPEQEGKPNEYHRLLMGREQTTVRAPILFDGIPLYLLEVLIKYRGMPSSFLREYPRKSQMDT